jgi:hypothetical protein
MRILHVLAAICAVVLGGVGWMQYSAGLTSIGSVVLSTLVGALLPYLVALLWTFLVVPPAIGAGIRQLFLRFLSKR